jgi:hypothetical protein
MSNAVLPNFDWALSAMTKVVESQAAAAAAAKVQYRLDATMHLIPFGIFSKKDIETHPSINAAGMAVEHVKLFLAKKLILGWLYLKDERTSFRPNTVCRLAAYVRYYDEILEEILGGDTDILERWWVLETTVEYSQHSATRVPRTAGLDTESEVLGYTLIDWNLENVYLAENLALVSNKALDEAADHVEDWIVEEVEREVPSEESDDDTIDDGEL